MPSPRDTPRLGRLAGSCGPALVLAVALLLVLTAGPAAASAATTSKTGSAASNTVADWTTASPSTSPPPLTGAAVAYDPGTSPPTIVLFGGIKADGTYSADTWTWNGTTWTKYSSSSVATYSPPARAYASLAYDPTLNQLVLYGGRGANGVYSDTWVWNGQSWVPESSSSCPPARYSAGLAYDSSGDLLLYGGTGPTASASGSQSSGSQSSCSQPVTTASGTQTLADAWRWNGTGWSQVAAGPPALSGESLSYDSADSTTVLFGGTASNGSLSDQTWTWNGSTWQQQSPKTSPPARTEGLLSDVPGSGAFLVGGSGAGGSALADGWLWSGGQWSLLSTAGTEASSADPVGAFDASESRLVVFDPAGTTQLAALLHVTAIKSGSSPTTATRPKTNPTTSTTPPSTTSRSKTSTTRPKTNPTTSTTPPSTARTGAGSQAGNGLSLETSEHTVRRGTAVRLAGTGFEPGSTVTITFHSKPYFLGRVTASADGDIDTYVEVPASASPGVHHFEASGLSPDGKATTLLASVLVLAPAGDHTASTAVKAALLAIAVLMPVAAWGSMAGAGWWRRRRRAGTGAVTRPPGVV